MDMCESSFKQRENGRLGIKNEGQCEENIWERSPKWLFNFLRIIDEEVDKLKANMQSRCPNWREIKGTKGVSS